LDGASSFASSARAQAASSGRAQTVGDLRVDLEAIADLEGDHDGFAVVAHLHAVVPVGMQAAGQAVLAGALEVEFEGAAQVTEDGGLALVGVRQHLAVEIEVAGLRDVVGHGVEEPLAVVGAVFLGAAPARAGVVAERFDDGDGAAVGDLTGEHELEALADPSLRSGMAPRKSCTVSRKPRPSRSPL
jgi:hypothetical protein